MTAAELARVVIDRLKVAAVDPHFDPVRVLSSVDGAIQRIEIDLQEIDDVVLHLAEEFRRFGAIVGPDGTGPAPEDEAPCPPS